MRFGKSSEEKMFTPHAPKNAVDQRMFYASLGFLIFIVLAILYPLEYKLNIWMMMAFVLFPSAMLAIIFADAIRIRSPGFVSEIGHSSLRNPDPWAIVSEDYVSGDSDKPLVRINFAIFPLGGYQWKFFYDNGGGRNGYVIIPDTGYLRVGASFMSLYHLHRVEFAVLPPNVRSRLTSHPAFSYSSPFWIGLFPVSTSMIKTLDENFNKKNVENLMGNLMEIFKRTEADSTQADSLRRTAINRSMQIVSKSKIPKTIQVPGDTTEEKRDE